MCVEGVGAVPISSSFRYFENQFDGSFRCTWRPAGENISKRVMFWDWKYHLARIQQNNYTEVLSSKHNRLKWQLKSGFITSFCSHKLCQENRQILCVYPEAVMSTDPAPLYAINDPKRALLSAQKMTSKQWAWKCFRIKEMKMISKLTWNFQSDNFVSWPPQRNRAKWGPPLSSYLSSVYWL